MLRRILFISLALLILSSALGFTKLTKTALASSYTADANLERQILASTVRISLFAAITDDQGNPQYITVNGQKSIQYTVGEGLGTLARSGQDVFIVTHDHWTLLTANLHKAQFHTASGDLLLELSGMEFQQLIRYRDGGTMTLNAPEELAAGLTAVPLGDGRSMQKNDVVLLAYRHPQTDVISVVPMLVTELTTHLEQPAYKLLSLNGERVVHGNSGGGLFVDGQLAANMWEIVFERQVLRTTGEVVSAKTQTDFSLAAQLPATIAVQ